MSRKIEQEAVRLEQETGIDFKKYQNPEILEKISDLISFHSQTTAFLLGYTALFLAIIAALCFWFHSRGMNFVGIVLFLIFGVLFSLIEGPSLGLIKLAKKALKDSAEVVRMMLDFVKEVRQDIFTPGKDKPGAKMTAANLIRGVSYVVFIPAVSQIVRGKLKLFAGPVNFLIGNSIFHLTNSLTAAVDKTSGQDENPGKENVQVELSGEQEKPGEKENKFDRLIDDARNKIGPLADSVGRKVAAPAKLVFNITLFLGVPILLIIFFIFK